MRNHARITLLLSIVAASLGAGCSDSTSPTRLSFAEHLDSLYFATAGDSSMDVNLRYERIYAIGLFEVAAAYGVPPKRIAVTTSAGTEQWLAFEFVSVENQQNGIYTNALIATRDDDIHSYLYASYLSDGTLYFATLNTNDTVRTGSTRRDGTSTVSLTGSHACDAPFPLQNPTILLSEPCVTASFSTTASLEFDQPPNAPHGYEHFSFPATSLDGERLIVP
jgi:hypothetical protein